MSSKYLKCVNKKCRYYDPDVKGPSNNCSLSAFKNYFPSNHKDCGFIPCYSLKAKKNGRKRKSS